MGGTIESIRQETERPESNLNGILFKQGDCLSMFQIVDVTIRY